MGLHLIALFTALVSFSMSLIAYPFLLRFARKNGIVDNPNYRKLQREPVSVFGGPAVWVGVLFGVGFALLFVDSKNMPMALGAMTIMLVLGCIDDLRDLPASIRFLVEIGVVYIIMVLSGRFINDFHGLWDLHEVSDFISIPLSIIAGVGIINAVNLIDGVDGYSSGFGVFACIIFALMFFSSRVATIGYLSMAIAGGLVPFFFHNVFGKKSKMFIGDGGTLMLGVAMVIMLFNVLYDNTDCSKWEQEGMGLVPFTLAVMAIPVFDTLRVMSVRMLRNRSPFKPDKTHLHHLFIDMKFSHIGTTVAILTINTIIVAAWFLSWKLGVTIDWQLYIVVSLSLLVTFGFYSYMRNQERKKTRFFIKCCAIGRKTHIARTGFWKLMMNLCDHGWLYDEKK
jgi:UDP-N-acetylmuramyl pentapeptide phosphotransferase/UDP-N-acetylglucosamine-1-phosphate transferase